MGINLDRVIVGDGCWEYNGFHNKTGYACFQGQLVHRLMYEMFVEPLPKGKPLDHLCNNPGCVRYDHLELVTHDENMRRYSERRTECKNGHDLAVHGHLYQGVRECRECRRVNQLRLRERRYSGSSRD